MDDQKCQWNWENANNIKKSDSLTFTFLDVNLWQKKCEKYFCVQGMNVK